MIALHDVTRYYGGGDDLRVVLDNVSAIFPTQAKVGILARPGMGKTSLIRLLAGIDAPNSGEIHRSCSVSWPIGFAGALHPNLTADDNVRIVARIFGRDPDQVSAFCHGFSELGSDYFQVLNRYSGGMRARLGMSLSLSVDFDQYLADEMIGTGDAAFRKKCELALAARLAHAGLILVSRNPQTVRRFCDIPAVLDSGRIIFCDSHDQARTLFEHLSDGVENAPDPADLDAEYSA